MKTYQERIGERIWELVAQGQSAANAATLALAESPRNFNSPSDSIGALSREVYLSELRVRSKQGDKYARAMLLAIEKGEKPSEDPSGD
jgi:hypothetical protein